MQIDAQKFDVIARTVFAPVYPLLAQQILERTGIASGLCLDLGSGGGYLGLALAWNSRLRVCLLDESAAMKVIAERTILERQLEHRVLAVQGDVHRIPLQSGSVDLVVSRGSIYFWDDLTMVLREIWRVLAPGGQVCIGGGFGSKALRDEVVAKMRLKEPGWQPKCSKFDDSVFEAALAAAEIKQASILRDESGTWITFMKPLHYAVETFGEQFTTACEYK